MSDRRISECDVCKKQVDNDYADRKHDWFRVEGNAYLFWPYKKDFCSMECLRTFVGLGAPMTPRAGAERKPPPPPPMRGY